MASSAVERQPRAAVVDGEGVVVADAVVAPSDAAVADDAPRPRQLVGDARQPRFAAVAPQLVAALLDVAAG